MDSNEEPSFAVMMLERYLSKGGTLADLNDKSEWGRTMLAVIAEREALANLPSEVQSSAEQPAAMIQSESALSAQINKQDVNSQQKSSRDKSTPLPTKVAPSKGEAHSTTAALQAKGAPSTTATPSKKMAPTAKSTSGRNAGPKVSTGSKTRSRGSANKKATSTSNKPNKRASGVAKADQNTIQLSPADLISEVDDDVDANRKVDHKVVDQDNDSDEDQQEDNSSTKGQTSSPRNNYARYPKPWHRNRQGQVRYNTFYRGVDHRKGQLANVAKSLATRKKAMTAGMSANAQPRNLLAGMAGGSVFFDQVMSSERIQAIDFHHSKKDERDLSRDKRSFGYKRVTLVMDNGIAKYLLTGMKYPLFPYQLLGAAFMIKRECSMEAPYGSILADQMGLGKTVQAIATIVGNPPDEDDVKDQCFTTLIIVPSSIKPQWFSEIRKHAPELGKLVAIYESKNPMFTPDMLKTFKVILTTFWELTTSMQKGDPSADDIKAMKADKTRSFHDHMMKWQRLNRANYGDLHQVLWFRIILDEAHAIKNTMTKTSRGAVFLRGKYRHLLSGTPVMNSLTEFFPLLRFLREPITEEITYDEFSKTFSDLTDDESMEKLAIICQDLMVRRTITDRLFGEPIVQLPTATKSLLRLRLTEAEELLYAAMEVRLLELRNEDIDDEDPRKPMQTRFAAITRLRQFIASPDLVAPQFIDLFGTSELQLIQQKLQYIIRPENKSELDYDLCCQLANRFKSWITYKEHDVYMEYSNDTPEEILTCRTCADTSEDMYKLKKCGHFFCATCLAIDRIDEELFESDNVFIGTCPSCRIEFKRIDAIRQQQEDEEDERPARRGRSVKKPTGGRDYHNFRPRPTKDQVCFKKWLKDIDGDTIEFCSSTKLQALERYLISTVLKDDKNKLIIFTQFRQLMVMIGMILRKLEIRFVYFSGDMSGKQRGRAVSTLETELDVKVMVAGLKCGGLGLNLNFANKVILMDIWWNECIDQQAFGRVFRIGQHRETSFVKVVVDETVDEQMILLLQYNKINAIKKTLQDELEVDVPDIFQSTRPNETFVGLMESYISIDDEPASDDEAARQSGCSSESSDNTYTPGELSKYRAALQARQQLDIQTEDHYYDEEEDEDEDEKVLPKIEQSSAARHRKQPSYDQRPDGTYDGLYGADDE